MTAPYCSSRSCAPVMFTVAVAHAPLPLLVTVGPFW
jgi:hypothetical protein